MVAVGADRLRLGGCTRSEGVKSMTEICGVRAGAAGSWRNDTWAECRVKEERRGRLEGGSCRCKV